ncbi:hypothetical protein H6P81_010045 [Aristolochia fimbriata]|uniref:Uncharacterized protein n=1 Tax=Aristolochia fimbriata TaxID=158543 RepID=A0AAV7EMQ7_ARIFI|nr:hypothetical protein H6P81_010045 [Aristolochia fimbriata]
MANWEEVGGDIVKSSRRSLELRVAEPEDFGDCFRSLPSVIEFPRPATGPREEHSLPSSNGAHYLLMNRLFPRPDPLIPPPLWNWTNELATPRLLRDLMILCVPHVATVADCPLVPYFWSNLWCYAHRIYFTIYGNSAFQVFVKVSERGETAGRGSDRLCVFFRRIDGHRAVKTEGRGRGKVTSGGQDWQSSPAFSAAAE